MKRHTAHGNRHTGWFPPARLPFAACLLPLLALLAACAAPPRIVEGRAYPLEMARGPTLDIQVFRRTTEIELTNTTARAFGPSTLWLNARFSRQIGGLSVGERLRLPLRDFHDQWGDTFRSGGFFATELPETLALAEIETAGSGGGAERVVLGLVVVGPQER